VPPESLSDLRVHLATRLRERGLGGAALFALPEVETTVDGFLPEPLVAGLRQWLRRVAGDERSRTLVAERTLRGVLGSLPVRAQTLAEAGDAQMAGWRQLHEDVDAVFSAARPQLLESLIDGSLLSGEVLARWQELTADGGFARRLDRSPRGLTDRLGDLVRRSRDDGQPLDVPVTEAVTSAIRSALSSAAEDVLTRWRLHPFGSALLEARGPQVSVNDVDAQLERTIRDWRVGVSEQVTAASLPAVSAPSGSIPPGESSSTPASTPASTSSAATPSSPGRAPTEAVDSPTDAVAAAGATAPKGARIDLQAAADVMFVVAVDERSERVPEQDGDEPTDTVAAARRIVSNFLGEDTVRSIAAQARADLVSRAAVLLDAERRRLERLLESADIRNGRAEALRTAAELVNASR
jgi:hypothetical protein